MVDKYSTIRLAGFSLDWELSCDAGERRQNCRSKKNSLIFYNCFYLQMDKDDTEDLVETGDYEGRGGTGSVHVKKTAEDDEVFTTLIRP